MNIKAEGSIYIGGAQRRLKLGTNATSEYCRMNGVSLSEFGDRFARLEIGDLRDLTYCALWAGANGSVEFTPFDVGDWMDEVGVFESVIAFFNSIEVPKQGTNKTPSKKK
jgi:hypothetical protein